MLWSKSNCFPLIHYKPNSVTNRRPLLIYYVDFPYVLSLSIDVELFIFETGYASNDFRKNTLSQSIKMQLFSNQKKNVCNITDINTTLP